LRQGGKREEGRGKREEGSDGIREEDREGRSGTYLIPRLLLD